MTSLVDDIATDDASAAKKKEEFERMMKERDAQRKEKWAADRAEEVGEAGTVSAACKVFWDQFQAERKALSGATTILLKEPLPTPEENGAFLDALTQRVLALSALISQHTHALPKYDVKRALTEAGETRTQLEQARGKLVPRKKFSFGQKRGKRPAATVAPGADAAGAAGRAGGGGGGDGAGCGGVAGEAGEGGSGGGVAEATHMLSGRTGEVLVVAPGALAGSGGSDYFLKDLTGCVVVFMETLSALKLHNIQGCTVFTGPVAGSVFAREVSGSTLHLVARQLRIHDSTDVVWFTRTMSPPIIEDCSGMLFAPYAATYPALEGQLTDCGLVGDALEATYKGVKDFKWHRAQASPNWALLEDKAKAPGADAQGRSAEHFRALSLWSPPPEAARLGLFNASAPKPAEPGAEDAVGGGAAGGGGGGGAGGDAAGGGSEDEDEL